MAMTNDDVYMEEMEKKYEREIDEKLDYKLSEFCRNFSLTGQRKHDALIALRAIISGHADNFRGD